MKHCIDCKYYIPGGVEHNCDYPYPKKMFSHKYTCPLKQACANFKDKKQ